MEITFTHMTEIYDKKKDISVLVHHIELNKSGWVGEVTGDIIKFILWSSDTPLSIAEIVAAQEQAEVSHLCEKSVTQILEKLEKQNEVVRRNDFSYSLSIKEKGDLDNKYSQAEFNDNLVKEKVLKVAQELLGKDAEVNWDELWVQFLNTLILPTLMEAGAKTYEMLVGQSHKSDSDNIVQGFLEEHSSEIQRILKEMSLALFDEKQPECRSFVIRTLNGIYLQLATALPENVIENFYNGNQTKQLRLLVDTNVLLYLLDLVSPSKNHVVSLLLDTLDSLSESIKFKFYVTPSTINEFKRLISHYNREAEDLRVTPNIAEAASLSNLPEVIQTYINKCSNSDYRITANDYFRPYIDGFLAVLRDKNIEVLQIPQDKYDENEKVSQDATEFLAENNAHFVNEPHRKKNSYQVWHDVTFWHSLNDQRGGASIQSILDADWFGLSLDSSLIHFDRKKRQFEGVPLIVHPSALMQTLQILLPGNENIEERIISLMQLPFLLEGREVEFETMSLKVLNTLSRYEDLEDLAPETITTLLCDQVLSDRLNKTTDTSKKEELIKEAVITELVNEQEKHKKTAENLEKSSEEKKKIEIEKLSLVEDLKKLNVHNELEIKSLQHTSEQKYNALLKSNEEDKLESKKAISHLKDSNKCDFIIFSSILISIISVIGTYIFISHIDLKIFDDRFVRILFYLLPLPVISYITENRLKRVFEYDKFKNVQRMLSFAKVLYWIYGSLFLTILGSYVWEKINVIF